MEENIHEILENVFYELLVSRDGSSPRNDYDKGWNAGALYGISKARREIEKATGQQMRLLMVPDRK